MQKFLHLTTLFITLLFFSARSQVSITNIASPYAEDFNSLSSVGPTASTLPAGWSFIETGSNANTTYGIDDGGSNAGNTYSYGTDAASERALGSLRSGNLQSAFGVSFVNNTGGIISAVTVNYRGEQWRLGAINRDDTLQFEYSTDATLLSDGTWQNTDALDFITPSAAGPAGAFDGNASGNNSALSFTITGLNIANGAAFWIRWTDSDATGSDDGLAVDDVSISFAGNPATLCQEPVSQATSLILTPSSTSISGSFTAAAPAVDEYLVIRSTASTLSASPADAGVYSAGQSFGGGTVVFSGTAALFTDNTLAPSTQYYYFVFASNSENCNGGPNYLSTNPLTNNATTLALPACSTPAASPTSLMLTPSNNSVSGSFTTSATANRYLIVRSVNASLGAAPANGITYTAGQAFGNGTVVQYSTAVSFAATSLTAGTQYYFFVFASNGDCNGEPFYRSIALTGNTSTTNTNTGTPPGYYNAAAGLNCASLKTALKNIISTNTTQLVYTPAVWNAVNSMDIHQKDNNSGNAIWDIYSDNPAGPEAYYFTPVTDQCGSYAAEGDCYGREHSFPREWFDGNVYPMFSDLHHIFPVDGKVNEIHSSNPYGEVSNPVTTTTNGSKSGLNSFGCYTGTVFEPINAYKGDIARAQLYMVTRYQDSMIKWKNNGSADNVLNGTLYPSLDDWYIQLLLKWNKQDPVSQKEIDRNNAIYALQGNRNPFVDMPEYADSIFKCVTYNCTVVPVTLIDFSAYKTSQSVDLKWTVNRETDFKQYEIERSTDGRSFSAIAVIKGQQSGNYSFADRQFANATTIFYRLKMVDADGKFSYSKVIPVRLLNTFDNALIFPNPAGNAITLQLKNGLTEAGYVKVNDITGRLVLHKKINAQQNIIALDVHYLAAGKYVLTIQNSNTHTQQSFMIVR